MQKIRVWLGHPLASLVIIVVWWVGGIIVSPNSTTNPTLDIIIKALLALLVLAALVVGIILCLDAGKFPFEEHLPVSNYVVWYSALRIMRWCITVSIIIWIVSEPKIDWEVLTIEILTAAVYFGAALEMRLSHLLQSQLESNSP